MKKVLSLVLLLMFWIFLTWTNSVHPVFLPPMHSVLHALHDLLLSSGLDVMSTLGRTIAGFLLGVFIAVPLGVFLGVHRGLYNTVSWYIDFLRSVPVTAMFPLFLVFFGFGNTSKIAMSAWASGFILLVNTINGVRSTKLNRRVMAQVKHATRTQILTKITFPETLPFIFTGMKIGTSWSLIVVLVAEMFIGTTHGLGRRIYDASILFDTPMVLACIFIVGCVGLVTNYLLTLWEKSVVHWKV
ncbi:MAG: ABC transporter permease [Candidatus Woesearchaeota archaeon]|nr:ABC transporter permease [Candidatus Woesearchaeota archaeon]